MVIKSCIVKEKKKEKKYASDKSINELNYCDHVKPISKCKLYTLNVCKFCQLYLNEAGGREMIKQRKI